VVFENPLQRHLQTPNILSKHQIFKQVTIKDNTLAIIPTISRFGLDGNHCGVWTPPANTKSYLESSIQTPSVLAKHQVLSPTLTSIGKG